mmetsp:Transcript_5921/g.8956  ORF Transcript_5921/g.8956 Transcript_5921/m.8956 type:complete len:251 (-) Transcript_5921:241-993(-)
MPRSRSTAKEQTPIVPGRIQRDASDDPPMGYGADASVIMFYIFIAGVLTIAVFSPLFDMQYACEEPETGDILSTGMYEFFVEQMCFHTETNSHCYNYENKEFEQWTESNFGDDQSSAFEGAFGQICIGMILCLFGCLLSALSLYGKMKRQTQIGRFFNSIVIFLGSMGALIALISNELFDPDEYENPARYCSYTRTMGIGLYAVVAAGILSVLSMCPIICPGFYCLGCAEENQLCSCCVDLESHYYERSE